MIENKIFYAMNESDTRNYVAYLEKLVKEQAEYILAQGELLEENDYLRRIKEKRNRTLSQLEDTREQFDAYCGRIKEKYERVVDEVQKETSSDRSC